MNEITNTSGNTALAVQPPTINLPIITNHAELMEAIQANSVDGEKQRFDRISVPAAGGLSFTVIDENNNETALTKFRGILLHYHPYCIWYLKSYNERKEGEDPIFCFSADKVIGCGCLEAGISEGQPCAICPKKQRGSDRNGGDGSDCHDRMAVWIAKENDAMPVLVDLPRTSLKNFRNYRNFLTTKIGKPLYGVVTEIGLEKVEGKKSKYSAVTFTRADSLNANEKAVMKELIESLKPDMKVDYNTMKQMTAATKDDEFEKVADNLAGSAEQPY
jgi:ribosomal protein L15